MAPRRARPTGRGLFPGQPGVADPRHRPRDRGPERYLDLAYWADPDRSVYRPQWTLDELERADNFTYLPGVAL